MPKFNDKKIRNHSQKVLKNVYNKLLENKLCDVVLIAQDGTRVIGHRLILSANSDYFDSMFNKSFKESKEETITLDNIEGKDLEALINFCYTGKIEEKSIDPSLMAAASYLQLTGVVDICRIYLTDDLSPENCLRYRNYAEQYDFPILLKSCEQYIFEHFAELHECDEFKNQSVDELRNLIRKDWIARTRTDIVFYSLMIWISHDREENREQYIEEFLKEINFPIMEESYIDSVLDFFQISDDSRKLITDALKIEYNAVRKLRDPHDILIIAFGSNNRIHISRWSEQLKQWIELKKLPILAEKFSAALSDNMILIVGTDINSSECSNILSVNLHTLTWKLRKEIAYDRHNMGVAILFGQYYFIGGRNKNYEYLKSVKKWNIAKHSWLDVPDMSVARAEAGIAVYHNRLYVLGGQDEDEILRTVEYYNTETNKWISCSSMIKSRKNFGITVSGDKIYVAGGLVYDNVYRPNPRIIPINVVEQYNIAEDKWTKFCTLSCPLSGIGCAMMGERLLIAGGHDGQKCVKIFEEYNPATEEWIAKTPLNEGIEKTWMFVVSNDPTSSQIL